MRYLEEAVLQLKQAMKKQFGFRVCATKSDH